MDSFFPSKSRDGGTDWWNKDRKCEGSGEMMGLCVAFLYLYLGCVISARGQSYPESLRSQVQGTMYCYTFPTVLYGFMQNSGLLGQVMDHESFVTYQGLKSLGRMQVLPYGRGSLTTRDGTMVGVLIPTAFSVSPNEV